MHHFIAVCWALFVLALLFVCWKQFVIKCHDISIPGPKATSWITGNLLDLHSPDGIEMHKKMFRDYGGVVKFHGFFGNEQLFIADPLALREITSKHQGVFPETSLFIELNRLMFGNSLTAIHGAGHRAARRLLNPIFAPSSLKNFEKRMEPIGEELCQVLRSHMATNGPSEVEIWTLIWRSSLDFLGCSFLKYPFQALTSGNENFYVKSIPHLFPLLRKLGPAIFLLPYANRCGSPAFRRWIAGIIPWKPLQDFRTIIQAIEDNGNMLLQQGITLDSPGVKSHMFEDQQSLAAFLLNETNNPECTKAYKDNAVGHINLLIFAAAETTTGAIAHALYELSCQPEIQKALRLELKSNKCKDRVESNMGTLLDAVIKETLRLHPPVIKVDRVALEDTRIRLRYPIVGSNGIPMTEITVCKNQQISLGILGLNTDTRIWGADATTWNPYRWLEKLPQTVQDAQIPGVFSSIMTFLGGERSCIGYSFALLEMKIALQAIILQFKISKSVNPVVWKWGNTQYPHVKGKDMPQLWLQMEPID